MAGNVKTQLVIEGKNTSRKAFEEVSRDLTTLDKKLDTVGKAVVGYLSISTLTSAIRTVSATSDAWVEMTDRLKGAAGSQQDYERGLERLRGISDRTFTSMANNAELYINALTPLRERGFTDGEILDFTETVNLGLVASATKGEKAKSVIDQLSKALQVGVLRGDAFNSVIQNSPALADALAKGLGVTREELAKLAEQGALTAERVIPALNSQLGSLGKAVDDMNITVGDALIRLQNAWDEALGQADMSPLVDAILELGEVISDPVVTANLVTLAGALVSVAAAAVQAGAGVVTIGQDLGYIAARITGNVDEIARADKEIEKFQAAADGFGMLDLYMSDAAIAKGLEQWKAYRAQLIAEQTGMAADLKAVAGTAGEEAEKQLQKDLAARREYVATLKRLQGEQVKATEQAAKAMVAEERKALAELEKVRKAREGIDKRYKEALAGMGAAGDPSYNAAQSLKVGARQALAAGDIEGAQAQAQAALKMLQDLAAAGENTYGFAGFIGELRDIELAANDIEQTNAEAKLQSVREQMARLKEEAEKLKDMPVSVQADEASLNAVREKIAALAQEIGNTEIVIPVRVQTPGGEQLPGFAKGTKNAPPGMAWVGENGPELVNFAGGEQVYTAAASRALAARMEGVSPQMAADAANAGPSFPELGSLSLNMGGEQVSVYASPGDALNLQRLARKYGGTRRT